MALENKKTSHEKLSDPANIAHKKTSSEVIRNCLEPLQRLDENRRKEIVVHKQKGSLEDHATRKAEYKKKRNKKTSSASYGGYGKLFTQGESSSAAECRKIALRNPPGDFTSRRVQLLPIREAKESDTVAVHVVGKSPAAFGPEETATARKADVQVVKGLLDAQAQTSFGRSRDSMRYITASLVHAKSSISLLSEKCVLRAHMDGVRDAQFSSVLNYLVTASEDCMVKLWDIKALKKSSWSHPGRIAPCFTYRGHTGPLFACCAGAGLQPPDHFLYSAGTEGVIRIWAVPSLHNDKYPPTNGKNFCVGLWTSHRDVIWQLVHHPTERLLLSVSSDGTVKMWKDFDLTEYCDNVDKSTSPTTNRLQRLFIGFVCA